MTMNPTFGNFYCGENGPIQLFSRTSEFSARTVNRTNTTVEVVDYSSAIPKWSWYSPKQVKLGGNISPPLLRPPCSLVELHPFLGTERLPCAIFDLSEHLERPIVVFISRPPVSSHKPLHPVPEIRTFVLALAVLMMPNLRREIDQTGRIRRDLIPVSAAYNRVSVALSHGSLTKKRTSTHRATLIKHCLCGIKLPFHVPPAISMISRRFCFCGTLSMLSSSALKSLE